MFIVYVCFVFLFFLFFLSAQNSNPTFFSLKLIEEPIFFCRTLFSHHHGDSPYVLTVEWNFFIFKALLQNLGDRLFYYFLTVNTFFFNHI